jgi:hypothetical protein
MNITEIPLEPSHSQDDLIDESLQNEEEEYDEVIRF